MALSAGQRKFIVQDQIIGAGVFNFLLNALLAWLGIREHGHIAVRGPHSVVDDTIATAIILPILTCLIITPLVRKAVRTGKVAPLDTATANEFAWLGKLPSWVVLRSIVLAYPCLLVMTPVLLGGLLLAGAQTLSVGAFVWFKAIYTAVMAGAIAPVIALYVMATAQPALEAEPALALNP